MSVNRNIEIELEKRIASKVVKALLKDGWKISVFDGEYVALHNCTRTRNVMAALMSTDEDQLMVIKVGRKSFVHFVWGNGEDVISDYGITLEPIMGPINAWIDNGCKD